MIRKQQNPHKGGSGAASLEIMIAITIMIIIIIIITGIPAWKCYATNHEHALYLDLAAAAP